MLLFKYVSVLCLYFEWFLVFIFSSSTGLGEEGDSCLCQYQNLNSGIPKTGLLESQEDG